MEPQILLILELCNWLQKLAVSCEDARSRVKFLTNAPSLECPGDVTVKRMLCSSWEGALHLSYDGSERDFFPSKFLTKLDLLGKSAICDLCTGSILMSFLVSTFRIWRRWIISLTSSWVSESKRISEVRKGLLQGTSDAVSFKQPQVLPSDCNRQWAMPKPWFWGLLGKLSHSPLKSTITCLPSNWAVQTQRWSELL